ncbi:MAG: penicillin-binding transpeptidase domain-containing protein [Lachnospiraceae bacterium]|jgi:penicillin-binding protein 2|nr:penicillin-binding transpeptidase domain-containing protein [Lachnospiraceae bacterium]MEE3461597.1 penicillin-binding transpeptidase domain-containing protein [Lachnospiraceae bacterium]
MLDEIRESLRKFVNSRYLLLSIVFVILSLILVLRMFRLQIVQSDELEKNVSEVQEKSKPIKAARGRIYDCNGVLLAYNKLSYNVIYQDLGLDQTSEEKNRMIELLIRIIEKNGGSVDVEFYIERDRSGRLKYNISGNSLLHFKAEVFGLKSVNDLTVDEKEMTADQMYEHLRYDSVNTGGFDIGDQYDDDMALKIMAIRYNMFIKRFTKYDPVTISKDVSQKTVASIKEHSDVLKGFDITEDISRVYNKSKYYSNIIGYTGGISDEKLAELKEDDPDTDYTSDDQIGITGIEESCEKYLKGKKGEEKITINTSTSRIVSEVAVSQAKAGNDVYLSIDTKLQKECYKLLEEQITGILLQNIVDSPDAGTRGQSTKNIKTPIYDVYNALIANNIIDVDRFTEEDASDLERSTYKKFKAKRKVIFGKLRGWLESKDFDEGSLDKRNSEFINYIYTFMKNEDLLYTSKVKSSSKHLMDYKDSKINLGEFIRYMISQNYVNLDALNAGDKIYSEDEIFDRLLDVTFKLLKNDKEFTKMVYSALIYNYELSGKDLCLILFDQGDIKYDAKKYRDVKLGMISAYSFITNEIRKLEITPGDLGLDPCSGSIVITDVKTGKVKAMVSYPSYDNNKMANQVDTDYYYNYITQRKAYPLMNRPTMQKLAPGSTFKMVSSFTGLQDGVISPGTRIMDKLVFTEITPSPKDWSSVSHGNINVSEAIMDSCNYFFYTVGYRLSGKIGDNVDNETGLKKLKKYAVMLGLDTKSGVEVAETEPHFSDKDAVRSAIGQGTHMYAPVQLSKYVTTIANGGKRFNLSLLDRVSDYDGKNVKKLTPKYKEITEISPSNWAAVHQGMNMVVNGSDSHIGTYFEDIKQTVAGKTGTAQESVYHPNHAYFVSYAPYEDPKVSVTCVIPNGYSSSNAAELAGSIYKYYFGDGKKVSGKVRTSHNNTVTD